MKKRHLISAVAMLLALMLLGLSCGALAESETCGVLSYLNMTEEEDNSIGISVRQPFLKMLFLHGVFENESGFPSAPPVFRQYDSLNAMLMGLQSQEVNVIIVPYYTGKYLCSVNDRLKMWANYHPEKVAGLAKYAFGSISDGYSFMMKEGNAALRDAFDEQITAMKEDGTLQKLIDEHIIKASDGGEPVAIAFENFEGDPIKIAVSGSLPPMDYVAADGTFAGFNTAVLSEIGKRLQKNIELVQVDSVGRAMALSEGTVDVVFWTRGASERIAENQHKNGKPTEEEREARRARERETMTDEEKAILDQNGIADRATLDKMYARDLPEGTIITQPYFTDFPVWVVLK